MENFNLKKYLKSNPLNESSLSKLDLSPLTQEEKEKVLEYLKNIVGLDYPSQRVNSKQIQNFFQNISSKVSGNKLLSPPIGKVLFRGVEPKINEENFIEKCIVEQNIKPLNFTKSNRFVNVTHVCTIPFSYSPHNSINYWTDSIEGVHDFLDAEYYMDGEFIIHATKCIEGKFIFSKKLLNKIEDIVLPLEEIDFNVDIPRKGSAENATIGISNNYNTYILFNIDNFDIDDFD